MAKLTGERIEQLATQNGVKRTAVENFLGSLGDLSEAEAKGNLRLDAKSYGWNSATVAAIKTGIHEYYGKP